MTATVTAADRALKASREIERLQARIATLAAVRAAAVREMRAAGLSHAQVAEALGVTRARAQQLAG